ncbi:Bifunctional protein GlmU [compost metagenome]
MIWLDNIRVEPKYAFTGETKEVDGRVVKRIKSLRAFGNVDAYCLGGFIASEENLSHLGDCWVSKDAIVMDNAIVKGNARVTDNSIIKDNAIIRKEATIRGKSLVSNDAVVSGEAIIVDTKVLDYVHVSDNSYLENCEVTYSGDVGGRARLKNSIITDRAKLYGNIRLIDTEVAGEVLLRSCMHVINGKISKSTDYLTIGEYGENSATITFYRTKFNDIFAYVDMGRKTFYGDLSTFKDNMTSVYSPINTPMRNSLLEIVRIHFTELPKKES